jgi:DNA-binding transcriptional LysR family regulator
MDETSERWLTWSSWFAAQGVTARLKRPELLYSAYPLLLQAALSGEGLALGWGGLLDDLLTEGRLMRVGPGVRRASHGYFLCRPQDRTLPAATAHLAERVARWIEQQAASQSGKSMS